MDEVSQRGGVSKATIFRWWPTKGKLVFGAFTANFLARQPTPDTGSLRRRTNAGLWRNGVGPPEPSFQAIRRRWHSLIAEMTGGARKASIAARGDVVFESIEEVEDFVGRPDTVATTDRDLADDAGLF